MAAGYGERNGCWNMKPRSLTEFKHYFEQLIVDFSRSAFSFPSLTLLRSDFIDIFIFFAFNFDT